MAGHRNSGMCSPLWCVCASHFPPRHYTIITFKGPMIYLFYLFQILFYFLPNSVFFPLYFFWIIKKGKSFNNNNNYYYYYNWDLDPNKH